MKLLIHNYLLYTTRLEFIRTSYNTYTLCRPQDSIQFHTIKQIKILAEFLSYHSHKWINERKRKQAVASHGYNYSSQYPEYILSCLVNHEAKDGRCYGRDDIHQTGNRSTYAIVVLCKMILSSPSNIAMSCCSQICLEKLLKGLITQQDS